MELAMFERPASLVEALSRNAERFQSRPVLRGPDGEMSFTDLLRRVMHVAERLRRVGVDHGARVILRGPSSASWIAAYFGIHAAGACAVPVDEDARPEWVTNILSECDPAAVISDRPDYFSALPLVELNVDPPRTGSLGDVEFPGLESIADILFTSGTTSRPKGVVLTHGNLWHIARNIISFIGQCESDVEVVTVPLSHSFGLGRVRCMALCGTRLVLGQTLRKPLSVLEALSSPGVTGLSIVPAGLSVLRVVTRGQLKQAGRSLRYVELGSMALESTLRDWTMEMLAGARICHHYGLTEASRAAFVDASSAEARRGSIGRESPNVVITVRDEAGREVAAETSGELCIRGDMVMREYFRQPELTAKTLVDGELHTGDVGFRDGAGFLFLKGRLDDMINVGGFKFGPQEVEDVLLGFTGVRDCACIGVPDPMGVAGHNVKAFYVSDSDLPKKAMSDHLRAKLEAYKLPMSFERIDHIPRTPNGKLMRRLLRPS
jgi:long-chain acyl-CoA synthetase